MIIANIEHLSTTVSKLKDTTKAYFCCRYTFFFYGGFLSRTFTNHRTSGEGGGHFINSSLPLPPASQTLRH